jgi:cytochrome c-type biogenesis protein CcmE
MQSKAKLWIAGSVLVCAVGYLAFAGVKRGWVYYVQVDELLTATDLRQQRVRVSGKVLTEGMVVSAGQLTASFQLAGQRHRIPVHYRGVIPEMFQGGNDVVVEGTFDGAGVFQADVLMTKCASKYQGKHPDQIAQGRP